MFIIVQLLLFPTIFFILYTLTKSFKAKNWNKCKIRNSNKFLQLSLSTDQSVCFLLVQYFTMSHAHQLFHIWFHTVSELDYMALMNPFCHASMDPCILTNIFVVTSTDSHSSNGNTKFVKRERDLSEPVEQAARI